MSMILMLERISSDSTVSKVPQMSVAERHQSAIPLRIFNGEDFGAEDFDAADLGGFPFGDDYDGEEGRDAICLEKAWHGLHYLLTGDPWGGTGWNAFLLCGGTEQGPDTGYGPARRFEPDEVREINRVLAGISAEELWSRFDARKMEDADIYPGIWDEPEEDLREEYLTYFQMLKEFVAQAGENGDALQLSMT